MHLVEKRDGRKVNYEPQKIKEAIRKAFLSQNIESEEIVTKLYEEVIENIENISGILTIKQIQSITENKLMRSHPDIARAYIEYRYGRDVAREKNSVLIQEIKSLIEQNNVGIMNENANKDAKVIPTQRDLLAGIISKHYAKNYILPPDIVKAHERGEIHYHDLDYSPFFPMFNCMLVDLKGMLTKGFKMGNAEIEEPKSIGTATAITAQIIAQVASHTYGGTTINGIDTILEKYVTCSYNKLLEVAFKWEIKNPKKYADELIEKECFDAFQALEYEINTLHTSNGQTPFVTFGFGLGESWQARLIQKSILKNRIKGLGKSHKTAIFPKLVFAIKEGLNRSPIDPNYDIKKLAVECATKRMYPDILNFEQVVSVTGSFKTPMGCRSFLGVHLNDECEYEHDGRNNLGVVSINLPAIALEAKNKEEFYKILDTRLAIAKKALMTRIESLRNVKARVAPILYMEGACGVRLKEDENVIKIFENGRASISLGYIGIHETVNGLLKTQESIFDNKEKQDLGLEIVRYLHDRTKQWTKETGFAFSLYSTPSENLCDRFCRLDVKKFGIVEGVNDKGYYTNSFHLDVRKKVNPYEKVLFEKSYPQYANGGFICYGEYPNMINNPQALEDVWDFTYDKVPYYGTNTPIDACYECGFEGEFTANSKGFCCPACGNHNEHTISVTRRVCGYLGSPNSRPFNEGKQQEVISRVKHLNGGHI